jgi:hypothetical protein
MSEEKAAETAGSGDTRDHHANRKYKDSVFRTLFSEHDKAIELVNAVCKTEFTAETELTLETLTDVLFQDQLNDIAVLVEGRLLVLAEHQSSINPNMASRLLTYVGRVYEKLIDPDVKYSDKLAKLPRPEFVVLYNGAEPLAEHTVIRLSDAFLDVPGMTDNALELTVDVYNVNKEHSTDLLGRSRTLRDYSAFIACIRGYLKKDLTLEDALTQAIRDCIAKDILREFLKEHGSEVYSMLYGEFDLERAKIVWHNEGVEEGIKKTIRKMLGTDLYKQVGTGLLYEMIDAPKEEIDRLLAEVLAEKEEPYRQI